MAPAKTTVVKPVTFTINDQSYTVYSGEVGATFSLANYIRDRVGLTGTKIMCSQAGCGACVVTAEIVDPTTGGWKVKSVNSCVTPILSCDGWHITTVEGLGNRKNGLHPIQERLAAYHGTQCGYCSPGMVMQMNSLMQRKPDAKMQEVEDILDGNLCRCTGYRPIFDAFKSMASDAPSELANKIPDIEEVSKFCPRTRKPCSGACGHADAKAPIRNQKTVDGDWYIPESLDDLLGIISILPEGAKYRLVAGNTGTGIYDQDGPYDAYIDVKKVEELSTFTTTPALQLGGGMNLFEVIEKMEKLAESEPDYFYGKQMGAHLRKVANTAVRHMGTLAGNLMLKHAHNDFPSDIFVMMEALGASIVVVDAKTPSQSNSYRPSEWLKVSMDRKVILKIGLPKLDSETFAYKSYKITPRSQNAHAYVNAAFLAKIDKSRNFTVLEKPSLVYGGISSDFIHADKAEAFLVGKSFKQLETLRGATSILNEEVVPVEAPLLADPAYRKHLTQALLYKFILHALGDEADPKLRSGSSQILRNLSQGKQTYETDESLWPLNKPIPKIEGQSQCSGEAEYVGDIPTIKGELHAAFVITTVANCDLDAVDPTDALKMEGVVAYLDHKDIPGTNNWTFLADPEEIFITSHVSYAGQAVGLIVAETAELARKAAKAVKISYKNRKDVILSIRDAFKKEKSRIISDLKPVFGHKAEKIAIGDLTAVASEPDVEVIEGVVEIGSQYHFYMETLTCLVRPVEDGQYQVYSTTQWMHIIQSFIASALNIQKNKIDVKVRRLGGGYGGKGFSPQLVSVGCALAAHKLNKPVRIVLDLKTNMEMFGKRLPYVANYKVGVKPDGLLRYVDLDVYCDTGYNTNMATVAEALNFAQNAYNAAAWNLKPYAVITDTPSNIACRAPGTTQGHNIIECVMDHIADQLGLDPLELRMKNFLKDGDPLVNGKTFTGENPLPAMIQKLRDSSNFDERKAEVENFNQENMWRKRGIALVPCKYSVNYFPLPNYCHISVYEGDGSVSVSTGGIEMGQGLNTKVAATVAKELNIPMELISVKPSDSFVHPNNSVTGGSMSSELCVNSARLACQKLKDRMSTIASNMENAKWHELVTACFYQGIDLSARHMGNNVLDKLEDYFLWGCVVTEVEVDLLTGEKKVVRTDILEDTGASLSPEVDIGQIEGAFMFGLGLWLQEEIKFDPETGKILTNDTWEYKPPASMDIPEDLRVTLYEWDKNSGRGVLGSKATGEPGVHMGVSCALALKDALKAGRKAVLQKNPKEWFSLSGPATVEKTQMVSEVRAEHFVL